GILQSRCNRLITIQGNTERSARRSLHFFNRSTEDRMGVDKDSTSATNDRLAITTNSPGKSNTRTEIVVIRVVHRIWRAERTEAGTQLRIVRVDTAIEDPVASLLRDSEIVVPQAQVQGQITSDLEVILYIAANLVRVDFKLR